MNTDIIKSALKNKVLWYLASRYFVLGVQFLASIFLAVKLGAYYFGIWSFILLCVNIGGNCNWGIGNALLILLTQHKEDQQLSNKYIFNALLLTLFACVPPLLILFYDRIWGILLFEKYHLGKMIYAVALIVILQYFNNVFASIYRVKNKIIELMLQQTLWPLCMLCVVFCATDRQLLYSLAISYVAAMSMLVAIFLFVSRSCLHFQPDKNILQVIAKKSSFLFLYNAAVLFIVLSTKFGVSYFYTVEEFGYFSFAFSLAQGVMFLIDALHFFIFPKLIDVQKSNNISKIKASIAFVRKHYLLILHLSFYCVMAFSTLVFYLLPKYEQSFSAFILILYALMVMMNTMGYNTYLLATNREKIYAALAIGTLLINVIFVGFAAKVLHCRFENVIIGTLLAYILYSSVVNACVLYFLKERKLSCYIKTIFMNRLTIFHLLSLLLFLYFREQWIVVAYPFVFILVNILPLIETCKVGLKIVKNEKLLRL